MNEESTRQRPADHPREQTLPLPPAAEGEPLLSPPSQPADDSDLELEPEPPREEPPPYPGSPIPSYWAPWTPPSSPTPWHPAPAPAPASVVQTRPPARGGVVGTSVSAIGALGALVAFCVLPYVDAGVFGSFTGPQVATALAALSPAAASSAAATPGQTISAATLSYLLWAAAALAVIASAVALWQIAHRANSGRPISSMVTFVVLGASCSSLLILGFQYVGLQSSTAGHVVAAYLGSGFWGTVAGMVVATLGAMVQITA